MTRLTRTGGQPCDYCEVTYDNQDHQHKVKKRQEKLKSEMISYADNAEGLLAEMMSMAEQMTGARKNMIQKLLSTAAENVEMVKKMM